MPLSRPQVPLANPLVLPNGGSINTSGGSDAENGFDGGSGGTLDMRGEAGTWDEDDGGTVGRSGGSINTSNGGGWINTSNNEGEPFGQGESKGSIDTSNSGGYISTADGGGYIDTSFNGGSIRLKGRTGGSGGSINLSAYDNYTNGGSISSTGDGEQNGGTLNMSAIRNVANGGNINTSGGGHIDTSVGGGSIDTKGTGSIQFGVSGTRTTLNGSATADRTATLPNITGTLPIALISASTALNFGSVGGSGGFADLTITLTGAATTDVVFVTCAFDRGATDGKLIFEAFVSSANTVTVRAHNPTSGSIDPASYNFKVAIIKTA